MDDDLFYHSVIDVSKIKDTEEKHKTMYHSIHNKIKENHPDIVVIEDVALQCSPKVLIDLARLQGIIIGACELYNIKYMILKPTEWRKLVGFTQGKQKRKELKEQAIAFVKNTYQENVSSDEADAICIAIAAKIKLNKEEIL